MRLKVYRAARIADAMAQIRGEFGAEALILSTRRAGDAYEITAAIEPEDETPAVPASWADFAYHGVPPDIAARFQGTDLARALRFGALPLGPDERGQPAAPLLLLGAPGAGKTLTVARLATRLVMAGLRPLVVTADGRRAGAAAELAAYTRLLGIGLVVAGTPQAMRRAVLQPAGQGAGAAQGPVLIDTAGIDPFAPADRAQIAALIGACGATPVLVIPAGQDAAEACDQAEALAPLAARHLVATRLDLSRRLGSLLAVAAQADLMFTEAGIGSGATDGLVAMTPAFLGDRLRRARAAPPAAAPPVRFPTAREKAADLWNTDQDGPHA